MHHLILSQCSIFSHFWLILINHPSQYFPGFFSCTNVIHVVAFFVPILRLFFVYSYYLPIYFWTYFRTFILGKLNGKQKLKKSSGKKQTNRKNRTWIAHPVTGKWSIRLPGGQLRFGFSLARISRTRISRIPTSRTLALSRNIIDNLWCK